MLATAGRGALQIHPETPGIEPGERALCGLDPDNPGPVLAPRWDKRTRFEPVDLGVLGEDAGGVWTRVHPDLLLMRSPLLWPAVTDWRHGIRTLSRVDIETRSSYYCGAYVIMMAADMREEARLASVHR